MLTDVTSIPFASGTVIVSGSFLAHHRDAVRAFVNSEVESLSLLQTDQKATIAAIKKYSGDPNEAHAQYAYGFFKKVWTTDPTVKPSLIKQAFTLTSKTTGEKAPSSVGRYIDDGFVDGALPASAPASAPSG